jgi:hypothetical protein
LLVKLTSIKFWWNIWIGPQACSQSPSIPMYQCLGPWTKQHNSDCIHDRNYFVKFMINNYISVHRWKYRWNLCKKYGIFMVFFAPFTKPCIALEMYNDTHALVSLLILASSLLNSFIVMSCTSLIPSLRWRCVLPDWHVLGQGSRSCSCSPISHCPWIASYVTRYHSKKMY